MRRMKILTTPTQVENLPFEDLYENITSDWQLKARRLQARRWRRLKHQLV